MATVARADGVAAGAVRGDGITSDRYLTVAKVLAVQRSVDFGQHDAVVPSLFTRIGDRNGVASDGHVPA